MVRKKMELRPARRSKKPRGSKFNISVGKKVHDFRVSLGLNVQAFSKRCEISQGSLSDIENGHSAPSAETMAKLRKNFNMDINFLLKGNH